MSFWGLGGRNRTRDPLRSTGPAPHINLHRKSAPETNSKATSRRFPVGRKIMYQKPRCSTRFRCNQHRATLCLASHLGFEPHSNSAALCIERRWSGLKLGFIGVPECVGARGTTRSMTAYGPFKGPRGAFKDPGALLKDPGVR